MALWNVTCSTCYALTLALAQFAAMIKFVCAHAIAQSRLYWDCWFIDAADDLWQAQYNPVQIIQTNMQTRHAAVSTPDTQQIMSEVVMQTGHQGNSRSNQSKPESPSKSEHDRAPQVLALWSGKQIRARLHCPGQSMLTLRGTHRTCCIQCCIAEKAKWVQMLE